MVAAALTPATTAYLLCAVVGLAACQTPSTRSIPPRIAQYLDRDLLMVANQRSYPYVATVRRAAAGDREALLSLVRFTPVIAESAGPSADHGGVLTQLYERLGPAPFRDVCRRVPQQTRDRVVALMRVMSYHPERITLP